MKKMLPLIILIFFISLGWQTNSFAATKCPLAPGHPYKYKGNAAVFFVTYRCTRQAFDSPAAYFNYFDSWKKITISTKNKIEKIQKDPNQTITPPKKNYYDKSTCPLTTNFPYKFQGNTAVFFVTDTCTRQAFGSPAAYFQYFNSWSQIIKIDQFNIMQIPPDASYLIQTENTNQVATPKPIVKLPGCQYNNPKCEKDYKCINNQCQSKPQCTDNSQCRDKNICTQNKCVALQVEFLFTGKVDKLKISKFDDSMLASQAEGNKNYLIYSDDQGKTWTKSQGLPDSAHIIFAYDNFIPQLVYAAAADKTYQSSDGGKNFISAGSLEKGNTNSYAASIIADKFTPNKIYIGHHNIGDKFGIYISSDGGKTFGFNSVKDSLSNMDTPEMLNSRIIWDIDQDPQNSNILYITSEQGSHANYPKNSKGLPRPPHYDPYYIVRTFDGGKTWGPVSSGLPWHSTIVRSFLDTTSHQTNWFAGTEGMGLYKLDNKTKIWIKKTDGIALDWLTTTNDTKKQFSFVRTQLKMSRDSGETWESIIADYNDERFESGALDSNGNLYITDYEHGIRRMLNAVNL